MTTPTTHICDKANDLYILNHYYSDVRDFLVPEEIDDGATIIFVGGIGLTTSLAIKQLNFYLSKRNVTLLVVRGPHDDIKLFKPNRYNYDHVKFLPDYSLIQWGSTVIQVIGGGIAVDRKETKHCNGIDFDLSKVKQPVDVLVTHTPPKCIAGPHTPRMEGLEYWLARDNALYEDILNEQVQIEAILNYSLAKVIYSPSVCHDKRHLYPHKLTGLRQNCQVLEVSVPRKLRTYSELKPPKITDNDNTDDSTYVWVPSAYREEL